MALDHYVSQVHLRQFYSPELGRRMHALRKSDLKYFTPDSQSVCRTDEGNTNKYLADPRAVEDFLLSIEPRYRWAAEEIEAGKPERDAILVAAGFLSYLLTCSPAAMRINSVPVKNMVDLTTRHLDNEGRIPPPPPELGGTSISDLLDKGVLKINIDPKYPQAVGISDILSRQQEFTEYPWEALLNENTDSPFFTSDFPVALEPDSSSLAVYRIVPLTPRLAVRMLTDPRKGGFSFRRRKISRREAVNVNRLLVRSAEGTVFFRDNRDWVYGFVRTNRHFRVDTVQRQIPQGAGQLRWFRQEIVPFEQS